MVELPEGVTPVKFGWGCVARRWKPLPFQTKIDFPCPISDLTQNFTPHFRPDPCPISFA